MKKLTVVILFFVVCLVLPVKVYAAGAIGAAMETTQIGKWAWDKVEQGKNLYEFIEQTKHLLDSLDHLKRTEERYLKNLRSIMDVRSFEDFMGWFNRTLYIEQQAERIYRGMGVKVGGKTYDLTEIDEIPGALRSEFVDRHWDDMSEEQRYKLWTGLGLAPSNYLYIKTWEKRNEEIKKRLVASREMHADEFEEAAYRNNEMLKEYSKENEDMDINKILKNSHGTQMQLEMMLREMLLSLDDFKDYMVTRDRMMDTPPTSMMPYRGWNNSIFSPITTGKVKDKYQDF